VGRGVRKSAATQWISEDVSSCEEQHASVSHAIISGCQPRSFYEVGIGDSHCQFQWSVFWIFERWFLKKIIPILLP